MTSEDEDRDAANVAYKVKVVQFLDRAVPIILQNDNGPCPLLAISNVLLLRNNVTLSTDIPEISQQELMHLVANWLLEANNAQNKDDVYVKNQQKNIDDAISLLPRLATGIDVNVRFTDIYEFEYTPECAIFDLFHVRLVHGWLCDPQDEVTFNVIGKYSYNTLVEKLVEWKAIRVDPSPIKADVKEEPAVDFAAATVAALGVPTPHMKILSDEEFQALNEAESAVRRKGDEEEAAELLQALQLSQTNDSANLISSSDQKDTPDHSDSTSGTAGIPHLELNSVIRVDKYGIETIVSQKELVVTETKSNDDPSVDNVNDLVITSVVHVQKEALDTPGFVEEVLEQDFVLTSNPSSENYNEYPESSSLRLWLKPSDGKLDSEKESLEIFREDASSPRPRHSTGEGDVASYEAGGRGSGDNVTVQQGGKAETDFDFETQDVEDHNLSAFGSISSFEHIHSKDQLSADAGSGHISEVEDCGSSGPDDELLYEGERTMLEPEIKNCDEEPLYEGESISTAGQVSENENLHEELSQQQHTDPSTSEGSIIDKFLNDTASQLTYHGLFSLLDKLNNNELYIFFRNNHFSTLFKYDGQIYLLATDQGYLAQPDLVWEKLDEVKGDTLFATGAFQQFQVDQTGGPWNERDAVAATADFMSSQHLSGPSSEGTSYNSDFQLAMALQQDELVQQQQQQQQQKQQQLLKQEARSQSSASQPNPATKAPTIAASRLVTGPTRSTGTPPKPDPKTKERNCSVM